MYQQYKIFSNLTKCTIVSVLLIVGFSTLGWSQIEGDFSPLEKTSDVKLRVASYNVFFGSVFPQDDGTDPANAGDRDRIAKFRRLAKAVDADIWACQEVFYSPTRFLEKTPQGLKNYMESFLGGDWHISSDYIYDPATPEVEGSGGRFLFSRYPILWEGRPGARSHATYIDLPESVSDKNLLVVNVHFMKENHSFELADFIRKVIDGKHSVIPSDVMIMTTGDWNADSESSRYRVVRAADRNATEDYIPVLDDLAPSHMGWGEDIKYTIGGVNFNAGTPTSIDRRTIDFMMWKSDDLDVKHSYVVNTLIMDQPTLNTYGLQATDIALDATSVGNKTGGIGCDHFPYFADFIEESLEICDGPYKPNDRTINNSSLNWSSGEVDISCASDITISMDIEGVNTSTMEAADYLNIYYKVDGGELQTVSENTDGFAKKTVSITGLNGDHVEISIEALNNSADEFYNVTNISIDGTVAAPTYSLEIVNGSPDATYEAGEEVVITANEPASGSVFLKWEITSGNPSITDLTNPTTTMIMPAGDVTLTATYKMLGCELPYTDANKTINRTTLNWSSYAIDMTCASAVTISMDIEGADSSTMESNDYLNVYYKVDGGDRQTLSLNTDGFAKKTISKSGISGNSIELIIESFNSAGDEYHYVKNISIKEAVLAVSSIDANTSFTMHPNPASTELCANFTLSESSEVSIALMNMNGQVVSQSVRQKELKPGKHKLVVPVDTLDPGFYFARIKIEDSVLTKKIIIE